MDDGQVHLAEGMGADAVRQPRGSLGRLGEDHGTADRAVQPVHKPHEDIAGLVIPFLDILLEQAQEIRVAGGVFLNRNIHRLHNAKQMIVLEQNLKTRLCTGRSFSCTVMLHIHGLRLPAAQNPARQIHAGSRNRQTDFARGQLAAVTLAHGH
ncbi:hypothetical protein D3C71_1702170 [compost metagenome]